MEILWVLVGGTAIVGSFGWLIFRSWLREEMRSKRIQRLNETAKPRFKKDLPEASIDSSLAAPVEKKAPVGAGFGLVHLGVIGKRDPLFVEGEFLPWIRGVYRDAHLDRRDGGHPLSGAAYDVLRGGPFGSRAVDRVVVGRPQLVGAYADELWANVELEFQALVVEEGTPTWRRDVWQLRRRATQPWQVQAISDSNRYTVVPKPEPLPFAALEPGVHAAVDLDVTWPDFKKSNDVNQLKEEVADLAYKALREQVPEGPLAWATALDAVRLEHAGLERVVRVERVEVRSPLRHQVDAREELVDLRAVVALKAWLQKPDQPQQPPEQPRTLGARLTIARPRDGGAWRLVDLRWMPVMEST